MTKKAVLILAYGSPDSTDNMEHYLSNIRGGRPMSKEFVTEFKRRYTLIGGKSPLTERTYEQASAAKTELQKRGYDLPIFIGMLHWSPLIKDSIGQMYVNQIEEATAIVMAPHYSKMSVGKYWAKVNEAQKRFGDSIKFSFIDSWYKQPKFIQAIKNNILTSLNRFPPESRDEVEIVFTAHSLPARLLKMGDPYDKQLKNNAKIVAEQLNINHWRFSYQSAAKTGEPWLGPQLEDIIVELAQSGHKNILVVPIGFVCDHVEILYDIDIEAKQIAKEHNLHLERTDAMNNNQLFIEAIVDAIIEKS